jgi:hypothetical protein
VPRNRLFESGEFRCRERDCKYTDRDGKFGTLLDTSNGLGARSSFRSRLPAVRGDIEGMATICVLFSMPYTEAAELVFISNYVVILASF